MSEITFLSNKTRKEVIKYFFVVLFAVITWLLQVSIFNQLIYFDITPSILLIGCVYFGLVFGPLAGALFGITSSFFLVSILYDHIFYFSYPLVGLLAGFLTKNLFSDELLFFTLLSFLFTLLLEALNGWQYSTINPTNVLDRYLFISFYSAVINLFLSPFFYLIMRFITNKLKLR